jgi:hypothetical protein
MGFIARVVTIGPGIRADIVKIELVEYITGYEIYLSMPYLSGGI